MSISLSHVSFTYSPGTVFEKLALYDINLTIEDGEYVGIMGQTGCGKSTLLQLMVGLEQPSEGKVFVDGKDINVREYNRKILRQKVGMVFQYPEVQLFETSVEKDVAFGLKHSGLSKTEIDENVRWAVEMLGLDFEKIRAISPFSLSGGEKRRVAIAGILATKPKILILDEPVAGLDPVGREEFLGLTKTLHAEGVTIIMVSHDADALSECADRIIGLKSGRLILDSPCSQAFSDIQQLRRWGIGIGQTRQITSALSECGIKVPEEVFRYDDLLSHLLTLHKGGRA